jgi:uncharacterized membrane protein YfcA
MRRICKKSEFDFGAFVPEAVLLYLLFGSLAGLLSGLFGIGGGVVVVPFLAWRFSDEGFAPDRTMVMAVATSLATIAMTSVSAVYAHHRLGSVEWPTVARLSPGLLAGSALGGVLAAHMPAAWFKLAFAVFLLFVAWRMLAGTKGEEGGRRPGLWLLAAAGLTIGVASAILGIGGGTLSVPFLAKCRFSMRQAVAISSACGFPIALAGSASYIALGWNAHPLPPGSLGYIYLPAFFALAFGSVAFAPLGAKLAHRLPTRKLKRIFGWVLVAIGGKMLWAATQSLAP